MSVHLAVTCSNCHADEDFLLKLGGLSVPHNLNFKAVFVWEVKVGGVIFTRSPSDWSIQIQTSIITAMHLKAVRKGSYRDISEYQKCCSPLQYKKQTTKQSHTWLHIIIKDTPYYKSLCNIC